MKKFVIIMSLVILFVGCTVIDSRYTGPRIKVEPEEDYEYQPVTYMYDDLFYSPYSWFSSWWWNPYWYYGLYNNYYGYRGGYWGYYPSYYPSRQGRTVITKRQLRDKRKSGYTTRRVRSSSGKGKTTGKSRTTISRTTTSRTSISKGTTSTRSSTSSRGSSGTRTRKK